MNTISFTFIKLNEKKACSKKFVSKSSYFYPIIFQFLRLSCPKLRLSCPTVRPEENEVKSQNFVRNSFISPNFSINAFNLLELV